MMTMLENPMVTGQAPSLWDVTKRIEPGLYNFESGVFVKEDDEYEYAVESIEIGRVDRNDFEYWFYDVWERENNGYYDVIREMFVPDDNAVDYALEAISADDELAERFLDWFYRDWVRQTVDE